MKKEEIGGLNIELLSIEFPRPNCVTDPSS